MKAIVHSRKTALVGDSTPNVNAMLTRLLTSEGWAIERAVDNKTAFLRVLERPFDLIITGQKTSASEDVELLRKIKSVRPIARMIILADENSPADVIEAVRAGVFSYFCGPYSRLHLAHVVRSAMDDLVWDNGIEILSATSSWVRLTARCDLKSAERLVDFLRAGTNIPEPERDDIASAFHEILLNAMEHGAHFDPNQYVDVSFIRSQRALVCRIKDPGPGFSPEEIRHAAFCANAEELTRHIAVRQEMGLRPGGFGLLLAQKLCDEVIFNEQGNDVLLIKYVNAPAQVLRAVQ